jgi:hypothetical protein
MDSLADVADVHQDDLPVVTGRPDRELLRWQRRLLPFMSGFIVAMATLFFVFSGLHLYQMTSYIQTEHGQDIRSLIESEIAKPTGQKLTSEEVMQHAVLLLEADTLDKRYHQAGALLMSRIWSRQLAFITGMVLSFVGAIFILGKLSEASSNISGGYAEWKVAITSASPGIILSFFGTVLLITSLLVKANLDVSDGPAYLNLLPHSSSAIVPAAAAATTEDGTQPMSLNDLEKLGDKKRTPTPSKK